MSTVDLSVSTVDLGTRGWLNLGRVTYPPKGTFGPRISPNYRLVLLLSGDLTIQVDGQSHHLPAGFVALLLPGHKEFFRFARHTESCHSWVAFQHPVLNNLSQITRLEQAPFCLPITADMAHVVDLLFDLRHKLPATGPVMATLVEVSLLLYLAESGDVGVDSAGMSVHPVVAHVTSYVHAHLERPLQLRDLAIEGGVSSEYLVRIFARNIGTTPMRYVWQQRVFQGIYLLQHTGLSVTEIALRTGFQSPHHFSRLVRRSSDQTPTQIRWASWQHQNELEQPTRRAQEQCTGTLSH